MREFLFDCRTYWGADTGSDHQFVVMGLSSHKEPGRQATRRPSKKNRRENVLWKRIGHLAWCSEECCRWYCWSKIIETWSLKRKGSKLTKPKAKFEAEIGLKDIVHKGFRWWKTIQGKKKKEDGYTIGDDKEKADQRGDISNCTLLVHSFSTCKNKE